MTGASQDERIACRNLGDCVAAARRSLLDQDPGPDDPADFETLLVGLDRLGVFPGIYRELAVGPLRSALERLGAEGLAAVLRQRQGHLLILDLAQALSQRYGNYHRRELMAFQEVVSDLFDGFLSAEDRRGLKPPDRPIPAPLVKWGRPDIGPYALGVDQMAALGVGCGIVSLPGAVARADGLFAWGVLPHETSGHGILACERGLLGELAAKAASALRADLSADDVKGEDIEAIIDHWVFTLEEAAADVLGVLNMGPAAAVAGLIMLLAGADRGPEGRVRLMAADLLDAHPVPILRIPLMAQVVRSAGLGRAAPTLGWHERVAGLLEAEAKDLVGTEELLFLAGRGIDPLVAFKSAGIVGSVIAKARLETLGKASLRAIQTWRDRDERLVGWLRAAFAGRRGIGIERLIGANFYGTHVVAAAILEALAKPADLPQLHRDMVSLLAAMHDVNPSWGPLSVFYASDLAPRWTGAAPRPHGSGTGGTPRMFRELLAARGNGTGGSPRMFDALVSKSSLDDRPRWELDGERGDSAPEHADPSYAVPFPYPVET